MDKRYSFFWDEAGDASDIQQAILLELLKEKGLGVKKNKNSLFLWLSFLVSQLLAFGVFIVELLFVLCTTKRKEVRQGRYYTATASRNTTNKHLSNLRGSIEEPLNILILDSPMRSHEWGGSHDHVYRCRDWRSDFLALGYYFWSSREVLSAFLKQSSWNTVSIKSMTMCLVRLLRGLSISFFIEISPPKKIVFSLSGNACTSMIEKKMENFDCVTIHWLHGVGLGFNFDSFSGVTLVNNEFDEVFYRNKICGTSLLFSESDIDYQYPNCRSAIENVVIYTNLIHYSNPAFHEKSFRVEEDLLSLVSAEFGEHKIYIKPHPICFSMLGAMGDEYRSFIENYGVEFTEDGCSFDLASTLYISTISTSYIDLASKGACVLLYDKYGDEKSEFKSFIDLRLKFSSAGSLAQCFDLFDDSIVIRTALKNFKVQSKKSTHEYVLS